jgi:glutathione peroxidase
MPSSPSAAPEHRVDTEEHRRFRLRSDHMHLADIPLTTIDGRSTSLDEYAGMTKLIVNVASRCGYTPQYEQLEALQQRYAARGFTVLGFPSDQFRQELESDDAVAEYCSTTWGVTFPMFARVTVNGEDRSPLFAELASAPDEDGEAGDVRWNFEKFLVTPDGAVRRFRSATKPDDPAIVERIEASVRPVAAA